MLFSTLLLSSLLSAAPAYEEPERRGPAAWPELASWVVEKGKDRKVGAKTAETLGLGAEPVPVKKVWFDRDEKQPKGWDRALSVWSDEKDEPGWLLMQVERSTVTAAGKDLEAYGFIVDLSGRMRAAMSVMGIVGRLEQKRLEVSDPAVVDRFREETRFWRREAMAKPLKLE